MLTKEQLQQNIIALENQGASPDEIQAYLDNLPNTQKKTIEQIKQEIQPLIQKGEEAKKYMDKSWYQKLRSEELGEATGETMRKMLYENPVKFGVSTAEIVPTLQKGQATGKTYNIPGIGEMKSFQTEAQERAGRIIEGQQSKWTALSPFAEVPLAGMEVAGLAQGAKGALKTAKTMFQTRNVGKINNQVVDFVKPVLSKGETIKAMAKGKKSIDERTLEIADTVQDFVNPKNPEQSINNIKNAISDTSENVIRPYLQSNPRAFTTATLEAKLKKIEMPDMIKADNTLKNQYNLVRQRMIEAVKKNKKTSEGLWDARKSFDDIIDKQYGDAIYDINKNTALKQSIRDMRGAVNDFISDQIGEDAFKGFMRQLSNMYEAKWNIAEKSYKLFGKSKFERFLLQHPAASKYGKRLLEGAAIAGGGGAAYKIIK